MRLIKLIIIGLTIALTGCASGVKYKDMASSIPALQAEKGRIYFFRSASMLGAALQPSIMLDGVQVGEANLTERWDGLMECEARQDTGQNSAAYQVKFAMEVRGNSVNVHRKTAEILETLSGQVTDNMLELRGIGYRIKDPSKNWQLIVRGDLQPGATTYSGKGSMRANGKMIRACELKMTRSSNPAL